MKKLVQIGPSTFGIFDTFPHDEGRILDPSGEGATALMVNTERLLAKEPVIEFVDVLASKS